MSSHTNHTTRHDAWTTDILPLLPPDLEAQARALGAYQRVRAFATTTDLLRGLLAYAATAASLRALGAWAVIQDLADLAPSSWLERLRAAGPWLQWLLTGVFCMIVAACFTVLGFSMHAFGGGSGWMQPAAWLKWYGNNLGVSLVIGFLIHALFPLLIPLSYLTVLIGPHGETLDDVINSYRGEQCHGIVLSKLDEVVNLGPALDAAIRHKLKVTAVPNRQRVPADWHRVAAAALAQRALPTPETANIMRRRLLPSRISILALPAKSP